MLRFCHHLQGLNGLDFEGRKLSAKLDQYS